MDKLNSRYIEILKKLKEYARFQAPIDNELEKQIIIALGSRDSDPQLKALCCLQNTSTTSKSFHPSLYTLLETSKNEELIVHSLIACIKQVLHYFQKRGERLPGKWIMLFQKLLKNNQSLEVKLWLLRLIAQIGSQRLFFKKDILKAKPSWLQVKLSPQQAEIAQIIKEIIPV